MAIVNFQITPVLEKRIDQAIKEYGFSSKAEFFRCSALDYISKRNETKRKLKETLVKIEKIVDEKFKNVDWSKWPSLEEQMKDI